MIGREYPLLAWLFLNASQFSNSVGKVHAYLMDMDTKKSSSQG